MRLWSVVRSHDQTPYCFIQVILALDGLSGGLSDCGCHNLFHLTSL